MTCDDVNSDLTAFLDGELSDEESNVIRQHLAACAACSRQHDERAAVSQLADVWRVESASVQSAVLTQIALEEMASEMARLRREVETLRAEVAALKRPNAAPLSVLLFPHAPPIAAPLHII